MTTQKIHTIINAINVKWVRLTGIALLDGSGFTMALFIAGLAFTTTALLDHAKISILLASVISGVAGYLVQRRTLQ